jgi:hypothetical protein
MDIEREIEALKARVRALEGLVMRLSKVIRAECKAAHE